MRDVHIVVREEDGAWSAWSPTVPGLAAGGDSARTAVDQAVKAVEWELGESIRTILHQERTIEGYVIRVSESPRDAFVDRVDVARTVEGWIEYGRAAVERRDPPVNAMGEVVVICALPSDHLEWIAAQMDPRGDAVLIAACGPRDGGHGILWAGGLIVTPGDSPPPNGQTLDEAGLTLSSTVSDFMCNRLTRSKEPLLLTS